MDIAGLSEATTVPFGPGCPENDGNMGGEGDLPADNQGTVPDSSDDVGACREDVE